MSRRDVVVDYREEDDEEHRDDEIEHDVLPLVPGVLLVGEGDEEPTSCQDYRDDEDEVVEPLQG